MGFNHCYIQNLNSVMLQLETFGIEQFVKMYTKSYDSISGDSAGIIFIEETIKQYYNGKK